MSLYHPPASEPEYIENNTQPWAATLADLRAGRLVLMTRLESVTAAMEDLLPLGSLAPALAVWPVPGHEREGWFVQLAAAARAVDDAD